MKTKIVIGIDVCKSNLDFAQINEKSAVQSKGRINNTVEVIEVFLSKCDKENTLFVFEPTGTYSDKLLVCLEEGGFTFSVVNPRQSHHFMQTFGVTSKTDELSAYMLSKMGVA